MQSEVRRNDDRHRYELFVDGRFVGLTEYRMAGDDVVFPHTEIEPDMRSQGWGAELVRAALDEIRGTGRAVIPSCWYVAEFIEHHPEYQDLLAA